MSIENQLTLILAAALLGLAFVLTVATRGVIRLVRGPASERHAGPDLDDALPGRPRILRERADRIFSGAGAAAIYLVATTATAAKKAWAFLDHSRRRIPGSVTLGLVTPGPALTDVLRETSSHEASRGSRPVPKRAA